MSQRVPVELPWPGARIKGPIATFPEAVDVGVGDIGLFQDRAQKTCRKNKPAIRHCISMEALRMASRQVTWVILRQVYTCANAYQDAHTDTY